MFQAPLGKNKNPQNTLSKIADFSVFMRLCEYRKKIARWPAITSQGTLTLAVNPTNGDVINIGTKTYLFQTTLTNSDGNILIGSTLAQTQQNIVDAINLTSLNSGPGVQYALSMIEHPQVSAALTWVGNTLVITSKIGGIVGNSIATTKTFTSGSNFFDASTLGTTRAGVDEQDGDSVLYPIDLPNTDGSYGLTRQGIWNYFSQYWYEGSLYDENFLSTLNPVAPNTFRKSVILNHFSRRYLNVRSITPKIYTQNKIMATIPSPFTANGSNNVIKGIQVDASRVAWLYTQAGGTTGLFLVIASTDANGVLTFGTPVIVDADNNGLNEAADMILVNTDKILLSYRQSAATSFAATRVATLSGTGITMNTLVQVTNVALVRSSLAKIGIDKALLVWENGTQHSYQVVTITGTVPSYGAATTITGSPTCPILIANGTDKAQCFYSKSSECRTVTLSVSGTAVSTGVELTMQKGGIGGSIYHAATQVATDKFIWLWSGYDTGNNGDTRNAAFITVSGTTSAVTQNTSLGNRQNNGNQEVIRDNIFTITPGSDYFFILCQGSGACGKKITVDTVANTLTFGTGNPYSGTTSGGFWRTFFHSDRDFDNYNFNQRYVQCGTKMFALFNNTSYGSFFHYCSSDQITLQVYNKDDLFTSVTMNYCFLAEPKFINMPINENVGYLKIKNGSSYTLDFTIARTYVEIE